LLSRLRTLIFLGIALIPLSGCLLRTHKVERTISPTAPLKQATLADLLNRINSDAEKIKTLNATVDIATSVGGEKKGKVTEYQEIRGYILVRKPGMLRMIGLFPVVRNRAFDMVSDGQQFRLSIPPKNKFIVGTKEVTNPSAKPSLENLRPQAILDALFINPIDPNTEIAVLENSTELVQDTKSKKQVAEPNYILDVVHHADDGTWLERKIYFSRTDLEPRKQTLYDKNGNVATVATYDNFSAYDGVMFPNIIEIERPQEEYTIQIGMVKVGLNQSLRDDQFELTQPAGSQLQVLEGAYYDTPAKSNYTPPRQNFHR
jgi:outer membrane lipoprotein-sorting protein